jgi:hypothetical protein
LASCAEANHVKFIHAHHTPKKAMRKPTTPLLMLPPTSSWCSDDADWATATTKQRSTNSSSGVDARCSSSGSRTTGPTLIVGKAGMGRPECRK